MSRPAAFAYVALSTVSRCYSISRTRENRGPESTPVLRAGGQTRRRHGSPVVDPGGTRPLEDSLGLCDQRCVDHLAVDGEHTAVLGHGVLSGGEDAFGPVDLGRVGGERLVDDRHLRRVDSHLAVEPQVAGELGVLGETVGVLEVGVECVDDVDIRLGRRQHHPFAGVQYLGARPSPGKPRGRGEVLGSKQEGVGRLDSGDGRRVEHTPRCLEQCEHRDVESVLAERVGDPPDVRGTVDLREHHAVGGSVECAQVGVTAAVECVDPHTDLGVGLQVGHSRGDRLPGHLLPVRDNGVLQVEHHDVGPGVGCLLKQVGSVTRREQHAPANHGYPVRQPEG